MHRHLTYAYSTSDAISKAYSASVIRGAKTYIFSNGETTDGSKVIRLQVADEDEAPIKTLRIGGVDVPASDGPMAAVTVALAAGKVIGIRLYVIRKKQIIEYGTDTNPGQSDKWAVQGYKSTNLAQGSFLTAFGYEHLSQLSGNPGPTSNSAILLRLYYTKEGADDEVTQATYSVIGGWKERILSA